MEIVSLPDDEFPVANRKKIDNIRSSRILRKIKRKKFARRAIISKDMCTGFSFSVFWAPFQSQMRGKKRCTKINKNARQSGIALFVAYLLTENFEYADEHGRMDVICVWILP